MERQGGLTYLREQYGLNPSELYVVGLYGWPQSLDHEKGKITCIQTDTAGSDQSTKRSSAGVR